MYQLVRAGTVILLKQVYVSRPAFGIADGVQQQRDVRDAHGLQQQEGKLDDLGVYGLVRFAYGLDTEQK